MEHVPHPLDVCAKHPPARIQGPDGRPALCMDCHAHIMTPAVNALTAGRPERAHEPQTQLKATGEASVAFNSQVLMPRAVPKMTRLDQRLADMDAMGVDIQLLSPAPSQYHYWAPPDLAEEIARLQNEDIAGVCAGRPDRFVGLGSVAMQHPALAVEQVRHAVKTLGLKGIEISSAIDGVELSDPKFHPIWAELEALGALVFIHPLGCSLGARLASAYLSNSVGQPVETTVALSHLIFGGVLDLCPELKVLAAHGGGYLPTYAGRMDQAWTYRPDARTCAHRPSSYLKRLYYDTIVYSPKALRMLVDQVGAGQVVVGTDYPFDMGAYDLHALVAATPGLSEEERRAVIGGTLAELLGITSAT